MTEAKKLTKKLVEATALPAGQTRLTLWDTEVRNFGVRVGTSSKTYFVRYRPGSGGRHTNRVDYTIGKHGQPWTVDEARKEARRVLAEVASGKNPQAEKVAARTRAHTDYGFAARR